jgi:hypothetical protein
MKDPSDKTERPYEVLGVSADISIRDATGAYTAFLKDRRNLVRRAAASAAFDRLRRQERRLEDEIMYYEVGGAGPDRLQVDAAPPFGHEPAPPDLSVDLAGLVLQWRADESHLDPVMEREERIGDVSYFEHELLRSLPMRFPK